MIKLRQIKFISAAVALGCMSLTVFAGDCQSYVKLGHSASLATAAKGLKSADIESCLPKCDTLFSGAGIADCQSSLTNLEYGTDYATDLNSLSPNQFAAATKPNALSSLEALQGNTQTSVASSAPTEPAQQNTQTTANDGYTPIQAPNNNTYMGVNSNFKQQVTQKSAQNKQTQQSDHKIRWF